jgi:hypothetical protein
MTCAVDLVRALQVQADACAELGSPMYADLLHRCATDVSAGGVVLGVLAGHQDDSGPSALGLRLMGSVHRLVLEGRAGDLAAYYASVGGTWDADAGWIAFLALLARDGDAVREWLDRPPQTNEVGRSAALYGGLLHLPRDLPVRLVEIGASAGLNLRPDRFGYIDDQGRRFGDLAAELVLDHAFTGRQLQSWPELEVVQRLGSDVRPVDPATEHGRLVLTAYVWPDQAARLHRLRIAFEAAARTPAEVRRQDAVTFLDDIRLEDGTTTVLWHSVMWQYLSVDDQAAVASRIVELGAEATLQRRFAHLRSEPARRMLDSPHEFLVTVTTWPGGEERVIGATVGHGLPTTWL